MLGAIIGDIVGSRFEFNNCRSKNFDLFAEGCSITDDSIMTLAVAKALMTALAGNMLFRKQQIISTKSMATAVEATR